MDSLQDYPDHHDTLDNQDTFDFTEDTLDLGVSFTLLDTCTDDFVNSRMREQGIKKNSENRPFLVSFDSDELVNTMLLVPSCDWSCPCKLRDILKTFQKRSSRRVTFMHKLWNALKLSRHGTGVWWLDDNKIEVDLAVFSALLGLRHTVTLTAEQGLFRTHGFTLDMFKEGSMIAHNPRFTADRFSYDDYGAPVYRKSCKGRKDIYTQTKNKQSK